MAANEVHLGDIGTTLWGTVQDEDTAIDISGATLKQIILTKRSGAKLTKAGDFVGDGTDGQLKYVTIDGDLDEIGIWKIQAIVTLASGGPWYSDVSEFRVHPNL